MSETQYPAEEQYPAWVEQWIKYFQAGVAHGFLLHGNVFDYVYENLTLRSLLSQLLANRDVIAFYNRAEGITFALPDMERKFKKALGLEPVASNPALDALRMVDGLPGVGAGMDLPRDPRQALPMLERALKFRETDEDGEPLMRFVLIMDFVETIAPASDISTMSLEDRVNLITVQRWGRDREIALTGNLFFLVTASETDVHPSIRAASTGIIPIHVPPPDDADRLEFIEFLFRDDVNVKGTKLGVTKQQFANLTAGLGRVHLEDIKLRADLERQPVTEELIRERRHSILVSEYGEVLETPEPRFGYEAVAGHAKAKELFIKNVINPMKTGNKKRCPMGVLMTGPAGTGKTMFALATAREAGVNFVKLNPSRILGQYVGNSERNFAKALEGVKTMKPCILFIDEIDQAFSRSQGTTGVDSNLFKMFLEFASDTSHRGEIVILAATNRPDLLDAAIKRPGRLDKKIAFLPPDSDEERIEVFKTLFKTEGVKTSVSDSIYKEIGTKSAGYTQAEISAVVYKAVELMEDRSRGEVDDEILTHAFDCIVPTTQDIEFMSNIALLECNDKDLLPPAYQARLSRKFRNEAAKQIKDAAAYQRTQRSL
ncbi:ATP-dependent metalloprotease FtsH [Thermincola ferriacetica]|uniref:ATP-dependent metalloprotease FtsH n=1 Tax=Thermincola ferriacetica TaxID=281456 RepID=A0A0L6W3Y8_9FIRM|nr:ATP-binding protein [Thermincola ferriacetica]KNZ70297.1 ATP-dependent metalloprotease FtsH [Thermincola ferriacetica]